MQRTQRQRWESGQGLIEYVLILFFVSIVAAGGLVAAGPQVGGVFSKIHDDIRGFVEETPAPSTPEGEETPEPEASPSTTPTQDRLREDPTPTPTVDGTIDREPTPNPTSAPQNLLAYYALNEPAWSGAPNEVLDASGSGFHGTAQKGAATDFNSPAIPGNPGTCRYGVFDGHNDSVTVAHDERLEPASALTVMAWVRRDAQKTAEIVTKGKASWRDGYTLGLGKWQGWSFTVQTTGGGRTVRLGAVPDTGWHHVAGVFDGSLLLLYVDGTLVAQKSFAPAEIVWHTTAKTDLMISPQYKAFSGNIDQVRLYDYALPPSGIVQAMRATSSCDLGPACIDHNIKLSTDGNTSPTDIGASGIAYAGDNTYEFTRDVELCAGKFLALRSHVTLDGKGYSLRGNDARDGRGIFLNGVSGTTVKNLTVEGFFRNYQIWRSSNNLLEDSTLQGAIYAAIGIGPDSATNNVIRRNQIRDNVDASGWTGFGIAGSGTANHIYYNTFSNNHQSNISSGVAARNTVDDGRCAGNYFDDDVGSPDPHGFRLISPWPRDADLNADGVADCAAAEKRP